MDSKLIQALSSLSVETGSLVCLGCSYENACGIHGCAIMRIAAERLEQLTVEPPNDPLTLEELRGMDGEPVWVEQLNGDLPWGTYSIVWLSMRSATNGQVRFPFKKYGKAWLAYRRRPEGSGE